MAGIGRAGTVTPLDDAAELCQLDSASLAAGYASGAFSPVEVTKAAIARADDVQTRFNAFTAIKAGEALEAARQSEVRWRRGEQLSGLDGVPTTLKDIVWVEGWPVSYGSRASADTPCTVDAPSVARLRQAGAVFIGQTTTPEFGWKALTASLRWGTTRNPWNPDKTPGGSSGGAAVAAATGAGVLHLGTDGGGSIRIPAALTGIVGHKPSYGRVAAHPPSAFGTVAHIGPMTRTVGDAAAMLNVMAGRDLRDWTQSFQTFVDVAPRPLEWSGKRIGYWKVPCIGDADQAISDPVEAVLKDLELAGAVVTEIRLPDQDALLEIFYRHWHVGAANRLSGIDPLAHDNLDPGFLDLAHRGQRYSAVERMQAEVQRAQYGARMDSLLSAFDYVVSPTVPVPAFDADMPQGSASRSWMELTYFCFPINLSQQPACSVPCGLTEDGLPIGMQVVGARGGDEAVLNAALAYQDMYPQRFLTARPGVTTNRGGGH